MPLEDYRKIRKLGEGAHGVVHLYESVKREDDSAGAKRPRVERLVAVKKIRLRDRREGLSIEAIRELKLLQELRHKNVMPLLEVFSRKDSVYLVLENMESDLQAVLKDQSCVLMPGDVKQYFKMAMEGVRFIHARWILHRDLKPGNLLIAQDGTLKLADFGLAKIYGSPDRELSHEACTLWYRAPELLYGARAYGPASDIWSMGCVFAELMLRVPLFQGTSEIDQLAKIFACLGTPGDEWTGVETLPRYVEFGQWNKTPLEEIFRGAAPDALDLLKSLLVFDPLKRPTAEQVLQHPYFFNEPQPTPTASLPRPSAAS